MIRSERLGADGPGDRDWRRPMAAQGGLQHYLETIRERIGMIVAVLVVCLLAAGLYLARADEVYQAEADLLVTPVPSDTLELSGLSLLRESSDPTRDVETAAHLVTTREVAARVIDDLGLEGTSPQALLERVDAAPVAQSNIVAVTADAGEPREAQQLANAFARAVVAERTAEFRAQLDPRIAELEARVAAGEDEGLTGPDTASAQLARLQTLRAGGDPTIRVETTASLPDAPVSPRPVLTMFAGLMAGLILGIGGAFALHAVDPRLRREEQLRELFSLPILGRIPRERRARTFTVGERRLLGLGPRRRHRKALSPGQLSPGTIEAFRTLRAMIAASNPTEGASRSVLVTGPSPSEGKTTTAINLASSFALAGNQVILIEADFRRPTIGEALELSPGVGIGKVLLGNVPLEQALVPTKPFGDALRVLPVGRADDWLAELLSLPAASALLEEAGSLADYVVVDSPPLTEVIDALPLARSVDDVLLVVRLGSSNLVQLQRLGDLLEQNAIAPTGFVVVGAGTGAEGSYYASARSRISDDLVATAEQSPRSLRSTKI